MNDNQDHLNLLRKIKRNPQFSQRELAEELGFRLGKLNYFLKALRNKGLVKNANFKKNIIKNVGFYGQVLYLVKFVNSLGWTLE